MKTPEALIRKFNRAAKRGSYDGNVAGCPLTISIDDTFIYIKEKDEGEDHDKERRFIASLGFPEEYAGVGCLQINVVTKDENGVRHPLLYARELIQLAIKHIEQKNGIKVKYFQAVWKTWSDNFKIYYPTYRKNRFRGMSETEARKEAAKTTWTWKVMTQDHNFEIDWDVNGGIEHVGLVFVDPDDLDSECVDGEIVVYFKRK